MLASLITVALLASANAAAPARPSRTQLKEHFEKKHASAVKSMDAKFKAGAKSIAPLADDMGYYQWNQYDGACTSDSQVTGIETAAYGMCFMSSDTTYTKSAIAENTDGSYNVTTAYYSDADCATMTFSTMTELPGSCDTSVDLGSGTYAYVTGTMNKFSTPSDTSGYTTYNNADDCDNEENQMSSSATTVFGTCYEYGGGIWYTQNGCDFPNDATPYTDADCTTKLVFDDDDSYGDDDDDDDDDFYTDGCTMYSSTYYAANYCDGSAASALVTPSKMLLFAATAAAAVASMF